MKAAALRIADAAWEELRRSPYVAQQLGLPLISLPDISLAEAQRRSEFGRSLLNQIDLLNSALLPRGALPHEVDLTLQLVRDRARIWAMEADQYWTACDPMGIGFFGMFLPTAYCGGWLLNIVNGQMSAFDLSSSTESDRYLGLLNEYARLIEQFGERTTGQADRNMRMPKAQVLQARTLLTSFKSSVLTAIGITPNRATLVSPAFTREVERRIKLFVEPAFDRVLEGISHGYLSKAQDTVGLAQYPGGKKLYAELVRLYTTQDLTPEQVLARGLVRMTEIENAMQVIRSDLGFEGDSAAFVRHLAQDPRWSADTTADVSAVFQRYIDRLMPRFADYFPDPPRAPYRVAPLPQALQGAMTYGYYDAPRPGRPEGQYLFNTGNLVKQTLVHLGPLIYHELMPGHHLHLATQQENEALHPFRKYNFVNACNEGWAEYASTFAGEMGLYQEPEERYGRLLMDAFLTSRLIVDTGMNAFDWSLERAQTYMREHTGMSEAEIHAESLRYSCDIPGQALAYKLGDTHIMWMRERLTRKWGARFDLKTFHSIVVRAGTMPLPILDWHVEHQFAEFMAAT